MYGILKFCTIGALIETYSVLNCFRVAVRLNNIDLLLFITKTFLAPATDSPTLKSPLQSNTIFHLHSHSHGFNFTISVIDISIIFDTILISDEPDGDEGRRLEYLAKEKFSYITNYLEQSRNTDVHSVSTDDDSGKPGSSSAPSEFGFEETSGMTVNLLVNKNSKYAQAPLPPGHLLSCTFPRRAFEVPFSHDVKTMKWRPCCALKTFSGDWALFLCKTFFFSNKFAELLTT